MAAAETGWRPVYRVVCRIPAGQVATYGQIAALSGMPRAARQVGWALSALREEDDVPWHRVINAQGEISPRGGPEIVGLQRALLESEGVEFNGRGRVDLKNYAWVPGRHRAASKASPGAANKANTKSTRKAAPKTARKTARKNLRKSARKKPATRKGSSR